MCGRFTLHSTREALVQRFDLDPGALEGLTSRYNIAPTQSVLAVHASDASRRDAAWMRWGLIPHWARDLAKLPQMINARIETVATKPSYRDAFRRRRCLIPASGFYEWCQAGERGQPRTPYYISLRSREVFAMAGLWSLWTPPDKEEPIVSCTLITAPANAAVQDIHPRMPVILRPECEAGWLDPEPAEPESLLEWLQPVAAGQIDAHPVSRAVNSPSNDSAALIEATDEPSPSLFQSRTRS